MNRFLLLMMVYFLRFLIYFPPPILAFVIFNINPSSIFKVIHKLRINSSAGPDGLPQNYFRNTERTITIYPLSIMFRCFIDLHNLPQEWKMSIITPIFKKGSPSDPSNNRPISLTPRCWEILESLISADLIEFLNDHNLIGRHQHGFLKKHSTVTNLLESVNDWTRSLSSSKYVAIAYIDFQRAFDSVSYPKLLHKLKNYGIDGNLLFWISSFLTGRRQSVKIESYFSKLSRFQRCTSGQCFWPNTF